MSIPTDAAITELASKLESLAEQFAQQADKAREAKDPHYHSDDLTRLRCHATAAIAGAMVRGVMLPLKLRDLLANRHGIQDAEDVQDLLAFPDHANAVFSDLIQDYFYPVNDDLFPCPTLPGPLEQAIQEIHDEATTCRLMAEMIRDPQPPFKVDIKRSIVFADGYPPYPLKSETVAMLLHSLVDARGGFVSNPTKSRWDELTPQFPDWVLSHFEVVGGRGGGGRLTCF